MKRWDSSDVRLKIDGEEFAIQPYDYVGEKPLGSGCFVYLIDVIDLRKNSYGYGDLSIKAIKEKCSKTVK